MELMRMVVTINGKTYETIDVPEAIGPWLGRIMSVVRPEPHSSLSIDVY